ncbi:MAG: biotin transporter BioY [Anaerolineae bacterium]|nr:biotin transporter BioY [Anaerolineae bacterium]MDW8070597.1 biotin transporter BioY [Anaerolineae bacterium]
MLLQSIARQRKVRYFAYIGAVVLFTLFTILSARITIPLPFTPVPVTMQVLAVLLAGLVLGARGGALSQLLYLAAIAGGLPVDAYGRGAAALSGPTAGYLIGFVAGAFVTGWVAAQLSTSRTGRFIAALAGLAAIYLCGVTWLAFVMGSLEAAVLGGLVPFLGVDLLKAFLAASVAEGGRWLLRA